MGPYTFGLEQQLCRAAWEPHTENLAGEWLQPGGSPRRQSRNRDRLKGNVTRLQEENRTDALDMQEPHGFPGSCKHPKKPDIGRLTEILKFFH